MIFKLTANYMIWHFEAAKETAINKGSAEKKYKDFFFDAINGLPAGIKASHRHLIKVASLQPSGYYNSEKPLKLFLEKMDFTIHVFGEIVEVYEYSVTIFDRDDTNKAIINTTINISFKSDFREVAEKLKKGESLKHRLRVPEKLSVSNMTQQMSGHIDALINLPHEFRSDMLIMIVGNGKIRYDLSGKLVV